MEPTTVLTAALGATRDQERDDSSDQVARAMARLWLSMAGMRRQMGGWAQSQGLSLSACIVLRPLVRFGPLRSSALAEAVCLDTSWISRQVAHLVERGLVERRADRADGRVCILAATEAGVEAVARLQQSLDEYMVGKVSGWSERDRRRLAMLLGRLAGELEAPAR
ncbi:MAG TPA: MarR family transcriptional regulator [Chloroflexota bacterium]|nr:MarR family transcriptional regulator [Chloroflexota bacterium]